jgi:YbbR domain-containing protein
MVKPLYQIHLKILALLAAITLWFIVITVENTVYKFPEQIKVEILNLGKNLNLEASLPDVDVYLRVDKEDLNQVTKNDLEVFIDLMDIEAGEQTVVIEASSNSALAQVLKVEPQKVKLRISPVTEIEVEVKTTIEGKPAEGYLVESTEIETNKAVISGAQNIIDEIDYVEARLILDGTQTEDIKQNVALSIPESSGISSDLITITPEEMVITVIISSSIQQKKVQIVPKFINENDRVAFENRITISPTEIQIEGDSEKLNNITTVDTSVIEISSLVRNRKVEVSPVPPEGIKLVNPDQKFTIELKSNDLGDEPTI